MMKNIRIVAFFLVALLISGCSDTGTNNGDNDNPPGTVWTVRESESNTDYKAVAMNDSVLLAVGCETTGCLGGIASVSEDAISWTGSRIECNMDVTDVVWTGDAFAALALGTVITSPDGVSWQSLAPPPTPLGHIASSGTIHVAVTDDGGVLWSEDLSAWTVAVSPSHSNIYLQQVRWTGDRFAAVGTTAPYDEESQAVVALSPDGDEWTVHVLEHVGALRDIVWALNRLVAVGEDGAVFTSTDGYRWYRQYTGVTDNLNGICYTGSRCVAVGAVGTVLTSTYGINWTKRDSKTTQDLLDVAYRGGIAVAVGRSMICTSTNEVRY